MTTHESFESELPTEYTGRTVGPKEQAGVGVIALGILTLFLPWAANAIADLDFIDSEAFAILTGSVMVVGLFVVAAGIAIVVQRFDG